MKARLQWARQHQSLTVEDWHHVIWSNECYIELGGNKGNVYVMRTANTRFKEDCVVPSFTQSPVRVMIWACIMWGSKGPITVLDYPKGPGRGMNSIRYCDQVLEGILREYYNSMTSERGHIDFQQDNAHIHASKMLMQWFDDTGVTLFPHPATSPNVSPI